jgi:hypothetical protein
MDPEDGQEDVDELADPLEVEEDVEAEDAPRAGLGALGQLATAVLVVAVLILVFMGSSAVVRRLFG